MINLGVGDTYTNPDKKIVRVYAGNACFVGINTYLSDNDIFEEAVRIGNNARIGRYVKIKKARIGHCVNIEFETIIGNNVCIGNNVNIGHNVIIGNNVQIGNNVIIQNDVKICDGAWINDKAVVKSNANIGHNAWIDSDANIGISVMVGDYCEIGHGAILMDYSRTCDFVKIDPSATVSFRDIVYKRT